MMMKSKGFKAELLKKNAETEKDYHQAFSFGIIKEIRSLYSDIRK